MCKYKQLVAIIKINLSRIDINLYVSIDFLDEPYTNKKSDLQFCKSLSLGGATGKHYQACNLLCASVIDV